MKTLSNLLYEGLYDGVVTAVSRDIVNHFKNLPSDDIDLPELEVPITIPLPDGDQTVYIVVEFEQDDAWQEKMPFGMEGQFDGHDDEILINIEYNPQHFPGAMNAFIGELKDTLRHEIEHAAQQYKQGHPSIAKSLAKWKSDKNPNRYFTLKHEIPAFVRGIYKRAKMEKIPLDTAIDNFFRDFTVYDNAELSEKEVEKIKKIWLGYARKHLPAAKYSRG